MSELNQNIDEVLGHPEAIAGWPWKMFVFMVLVFATVLASYLGLTLGYKPYLSARLDEVKADIDNLAQAVPAEEQKSFFAFYSKIINLRYLLSAHSALSPAFPFIEQNTNKKVYYESVDVNVEKREITLDGIAETYAVLSEQLEAFNQSREVSAYTLTQSQLADGRARFRIGVTVSPKILSAPQ